ncbi:hypothetical protein WN943_017382 [Citrus x changshan-huyou]
MSYLHLVMRDIPVRVRSRAQDLHFRPGGGQTRTIQQADIIAHTAFGSSFAEGRETLEAQAELQECCAASISDIFIPGSQHLYNGLALLHWQAKLREEVLEYCGIGIPDADILSNLKLVNMVLLEALRLYGPVIRLYRQGSQEDAEEFSPLRFINGVTKAARNPNAMLAFGAGPRACIGQKIEF